MMQVSVKALGLTTGILWGAVMLIVGCINLIAPPYGAGFLEVMGSVYPGLYPPGSLPGVALGGLYGVVDGGIAGLVLGWLYNFLAARFEHES